MSSLGCGRRDEAVTISYGDWPADVFFLIWGFLPPEGRHADSATLFADLTELVDFFDGLQVVSNAPHGTKSACGFRRECVRICMSPHMCITPPGMLRLRTATL